MDNGLDVAMVRDGLIFYLFLVICLSIHEWAHAFTADKLGDSTPASQGRVTLNPIAHMDLLGTVIFPLLCIFVLPGNFLFGWGKPVMINTSNFKHPVRDDILTTLAGPGSNLMLALIGAVVGGVLHRFDPNIIELVSQFVILNVILAVFNMIPIPPLDGSHLMRHAVGMSEELFYNISRWGFLILILMLRIPPISHALSVVIGLVATPFFGIYGLVKAL